MTAQPPPAYFSQFASRELVNSFIAQPSTTGNDPRWAETGWKTRNEYAFWAWQTCGVACLRSILAAKGLQPTTSALTKDLIACGAYVLDDSRQTVEGLNYAPFVSYVSSNYDIRALVRGNLPLEELRTELANSGRMALVSVHPAIRDIVDDNIPALQTAGGHLVLAFGSDSQRIFFHNPSGYWPRTQGNVQLSWHQFAQVYASRGIIIQN